jgi:large subunit ribosomal protein L9
MDIQKAIAESSAKVELDRHQIDLDKPIKTTGVVEVPIKLHPDIDLTIKVHVAAADAKEEEATEEAAAE